MEAADAWFSGLVARCVHSFERTEGHRKWASPTRAAALGNPLYLEDALVRHPKLRLYLMHSGWPFLAKTKAILQLYPHVYVDVASFAFNPGIPREEFYGYLQALLRAGFGRRIMFGSGLSPEDWVQDISRAIRLINEAPFLTAEQKDDIFYGNAARFLRLPLQ